MKRISSYEEKREHGRGEVFITQRMGWVKAHRWQEEYRKEMRKEKKSYRPFSLPTTHVHAVAIPSDDTEPNKVCQICGS